MEETLGQRLKNHINVGPVLEGLVKTNDIFLPISICLIQLFQNSNLCLPDSFHFMRIFQDLKRYTLLVSMIEG